MPKTPPRYQPPGRQDRRAAYLSRQKSYSKFRRSAELQKFYESAAWRQTRKLKLDETPWCEVCDSLGIATAATMVHHVKAVRHHPHLALSRTNLMSLCNPCHSRIEAEAKA